MSTADAASLGTCIPPADVMVVPPPSTPSMQAESV